jgi:hypothetical protein
VAQEVEQLPSKHEDFSSKKQDLPGMGGGGRKESDGGGEFNYDIL